jgi:bacillithiol system protein YtxJ
VSTSAKDPKQLSTRDGLDTAFAAERFLVFKHSTRCPISAAAFDEYQRWSAENPDVATGWIDVIEDRALSQLLSQRTGVPHESPQALLLRLGRVVWHASHGAITRASLDAARRRELEPRSAGTTPGP